MADLHEGRSRLIGLRLCLALVPVLFLAACTYSRQPVPSFRQDLRSFGFLSQARGRILGSFTDVTFLSDDLILVTVNIKNYGPVEPLFDDSPPSKLLLFDLSKNALVRTAEMPVEKSVGSVRAIANGRFILLNESGLSVCSSDLACRLAVQIHGPMFVSPKGMKVVAGGNGRTQQKLLDGITLSEIAHFPWNGLNVIPGDVGLVLRQDQMLYAKYPNQPDHQLPFLGIGIWPEARFVSDSRIAGFETDNVLAIAESSGSTVFRLPVTQRWHLAEVTASASGSRFCFHQAGYTTLNSILNFLDIDSGRPYNTESVNVISVQSGKSILQLKWDPRPFVGMLSAPALSPSGNRVAVIRGGFLEVFGLD
jgi:hypothetical protein